MCTRDLKASQEHVMANRYIPPMSDSKIRSLRHQTVDGVGKIKEHFTGLVDGLALKCRPPQIDENGRAEDRASTIFIPRRYYRY